MDIDHDHIEEPSNEELRLLTRRSALKLLGGASLALIAGCATGSLASTTTAGSVGLVEHGWGHVHHGGRGGLQQHGLRWRRRLRPHPRGDRRAIPARPLRRRDLLQDRHHRGPARHSARPDSGLGQCICRVRADCGRPRRSLALRRGWGLLRLQPARLGHHRRDVLPGDPGLGLQRAGHLPDHLSRLVSGADHPHPLPGLSRQRAGGDLTDRLSCRRSPMRCTRSSPMRQRGPTPR